MLGGSDEMTLTEQFAYVTLFSKFGYRAFTSRELNSAISFLLKNYKFSQDEILQSLTKFILERAMYRGKQGGKYVYRVTQNPEAEYKKLRSAVS